MTEEIFIYSNGLVYCSVCTPIIDHDEIIKRVNEENPTGIKSRWGFSKDKTFKNGVTPNPCPCSKNPKTHKHYLMSC